jgi:excinuclease ABC subunit C
VRGKKSLRSQLDEVPGVGPTRKKALLRHFGTVKAIRGASVEELAAVPGMTKRTAEEFKRALAE